MSCACQPLVRGTPIDGPIATIPYEAIRAFLGRPSMLSKDELKDAPCVVGFRDRHIVDGAGHEVYIKGLKDSEPRTLFGGARRPAAGRSGDRQGAGLHGHVCRSSVRVDEIGKDQQAAC